MEGIVSTTAAIVSKVLWWPAKPHRIPIGILQFWKKNGAEPAHHQIQIDYFKEVEQNE
jgi:hypothetical protein